MSTTAVPRSINTWRSDGFIPETVPDVPHINASLRDVLRSARDDFGCELKSVNGNDVGVTHALVRDERTKGLFPRPGLSISIGRTNGGAAITAFLRRCRNAIGVYRALVPAPSKEPKMMIPTTRSPLTGGIERPRDIEPIRLVKPADNHNNPSATQFEAPKMDNPESPAASFWSRASDVAANILRRAQHHHYRFHAIDGKYSFFESCDHDDCLRVQIDLIEIEALCLVHEGLQNESLTRIRLAAEAKIKAEESIMAPVKYGRSSQKSLNFGLTAKIVDGDSVDIRTSKITDIHTEWSGRLRQIILDNDLADRRAATCLADVIWILAERHMFTKEFEQRYVENRWADLEARALNVVRPGKIRHVVGPNTWKIFVKAWAL